MARFRVLRAVSEIDGIEFPRVVTVSTPALRRVGRSGRLYLWTLPFGRAWVRLSASTDRPPGIRFVEIGRIDDRPVLLASDLAGFRGALRINVKVWPFPRPHLIGSVFDISADS